MIQWVRIGNDLFIRDAAERDGLRHPTSEELDALIAGAAARVVQQEHIDTIRQLDENDHPDVLADAVGFLLDIVDQVARTPEKRCQHCGVLLIEGPTSRDDERYARGVCGGCQ